MRSLSLAALLLLCGSSLAAQTAASRSPNIQGVWGMDPGSATFIFAHRFEVLDGGDEITSIPTFTLAVGVPLGLTLGTDFTTFSEAIPDNLSGNEAEFWIKKPFTAGPLESAVLGGYNTAADSFDGAIDARLSFNRFRIFGEGRAYSDLFGVGDAGLAATLGGAVRLTQFLALSGDWGRVVTESDIPSAWSAALMIDVPLSPHSMSLLLTNAGAATLHGVSRERVLGDSAVRYGFTFQVPIGGRGRWGRIFDPVDGEE